MPTWLEWWQTGADGALRPLLLDLDPRQSAYSDYTHWDWFALPRDTGRRAVAGPYVDYLCSEEYSLTLSAPVQVEGRFAGVAAADVYLRHFETAVMPLLQRLPGPAHLVNARGRVAASADPAHLAGSLTKGPDFAAVLTQARPEHFDGLHLMPCDGVPSSSSWPSGERPRSAGAQRNSRISGAADTVIRGTRAIRSSNSSRSAPDGRPKPPSHSSGRPASVERVSVYR
ncbi:hypothetical protein SAV31267_086100 [Streptomyces avermitilis]|uniref:Cache domain-containing protein n=1 Tax=Streptomyces avermitilis TaxID=33903 RepID=A0A4D4N6C3_STRAX|nr:hypothetical protein SAV31267_086100 [Streptomyces avermitilis]